MKTRFFAWVFLGILVLSSTAHAAVDYSQCQIISMNSQTVADLKCERLQIDEHVAQGIFMKNPFQPSTKDLYEGSAWDNPLEELFIAPGRIYYRTFDGYQAVEIIGVDIKARSMHEMGKQPGDLEFAPVASVIEDVTEKLYRMDVHAQLAGALALDGDALQFMYDSVVETANELTNSEKEFTLFMESYQKSEWTKADDCYALYFQCVEQELPVSLETYVSDVHQTAYEGTVIEVIYSAKGIISFQAEGLYRVVETVPNEQPLMDTVRAFSRVEELFALDDVDLRYARMEWIRVPITDKDPDSLFMLTPVWTFTRGKTFNLNAPGVVTSGVGIVPQQDSLLVMKDFLSIDARTGEEI